MSRPWFYPEAPAGDDVLADETPRRVAVRPEAEAPVLKAYDRSMAHHTGALLMEDVPEPPLVMVPEKPCPCEVMEALLRALGEPESDNWLEHFTQENRAFIPLLIKMGFTEAANQLLTDHKILIGQIQKYGAPDYALLKRHAAFEDALARQLGPRMIELHKAA